MKIVSYQCGLCKENERIKMTRRSLRKHLKEVHSHKNELFNNHDILKARNGIKKAKHSYIISQEEIQ